MSADLSSLSPEHLAMLREGSAISEEVIAQRGYRTVTNAVELEPLGFAPSQRRPGLVLPLHTTDGQNGLFVLRPDHPREVQSRIGHTRTLKYEMPKGSGTRLDCPPACQPMLKDPSIPLWVTEGQKKADSLASRGLCAVAILGVWMWKGRGGLGGTHFSNDWDYIVLQGRQVYIVFDSDVMTKRDVQHALRRLTEHLQRKKADVCAVYLPQGTNGAKTGVDDYFAQGHTMDDLTALIEQPRPQIRPAPPSYDNELPAIDAGENDLALVTGQAWTAIKDINARSPYMFAYGGMATRLDREDDSPLLRELNQDRLRYECARSANWYTARELNGETIYARAKPPLDVMRDMLAVPAVPLPPLTRIVEAPVFAPDGSLQTEPGYHPASKTFYLYSGAAIAPVPDRPTARDIADARGILDELLEDFPFLEAADKANAIALMVLPFARDLIMGVTPLHLVEAPVAGSGKGLLVDVLLSPAVGRRFALMAEARDDEEWRKRITTVLKEGKAAVLIDNITRPITSGALASALTAPEWTDRVLGASESVSIPVRCVWAAAANNPTMSTEIARRCIRIRVDAKSDRPWQRDGFRHPGLREWASAERPRLIWAALVLVRAWLAAGRPSPKLRPLGSYESWSYVIGGIMHHAGETSFLKNLDAFYEAADAEGAAWRELVESWWDLFAMREVGVAEIFAVADKVDGLDLRGNDERARKASLGKLLMKHRDQVIGQYRILRKGASHRATQWCLLPIHPEATLPGAQSWVTGIV